MLGKTRTFGPLRFGLQMGLGLGFAMTACGRPSSASAPEQDVSNAPNSKAAVGFECVTRLHVEARPAGPLPSKLVDMLSAEGQTRLRECDACTSVASLQAKYLSQYTQAFCGVASSVMVLNSCGVTKPVSPPYAPYAFFTQCNVFNVDALRHIELESVEKQGMTLAQTTWLLNSQPGVTATCYHARGSTAAPVPKCTSVSASASSSVPPPPSCVGLANEAEFAALAQSTLDSPGRYLIANFSRAPLSDDGQGGGHFSPVGAYHAASNSFLVFDVARYKYPPFWVKSGDLWSALDTIDSGSRSTRGFIIVVAK